MASAGQAFYDGDRLIDMLLIDTYVNQSVTRHSRLIRNMP